MHGDGSAARDFLHVEDTCRGLDMILHAPAEKVLGQTFNLATGQDRSILTLAQDVVRAMDYDPAKIVFLGDRPGQVFRHTGDSAKIKNTLGWEPKLDWETGLRQTIDWYTNNRDWWERQIWMRAIPIVARNGRREMH